MSAMVNLGTNYFSFIHSYHVDLTLALHKSLLVPYISKSKTSTTKVQQAGLQLKGHTLHNFLCSHPLSANYPLICTTIIPSNIWAQDLMNYLLVPLFSSDMNLSFRDKNQLNAESFFIFLEICSGLLSLVLWSCNVHRCIFSKIPITI